MAFIKYIFIKKNFKNCKTNNIFIKPWLIMKITYFKNYMKTNFGKYKYLINKVIKLTYKTRLIIFFIEIIH